MKPPFETMFPNVFGTELMYSFVIIVCSLMIYLATKEMYELSSHGGIKYFRQAFLFFAIAFLFRYFIQFLLIFFDIREILEFSPRILGAFTLFLFMYFSSKAIFYLLYSVMWKRWAKHPKRIYVFHILAFAIAFVSILSRDIRLYLGLSIFLFLFVLLVSYVTYKNSKKKKHWLYIIYILLFIFWILNIIDILIPNFLQTLKIAVYLMSLGIFLTILYKVLKKTGSS